MRGRRPSGPAYVEQVPGSELAKQRARAVLETMSGDCRMAEACERLDISEPRLYQLRIEMLTAAVAGLEPGHAGRPRQTLSPEQARIAELEQLLADKEVELKAAQARAEIAAVLPNVVRKPQPSPADQPEPQKKTRRRHPRPGKKKNS
jgi:hypothetical protein